MKQRDVALHALKVRPEAFDRRDPKNISETNNDKEYENSVENRRALGAIIRINKREQDPGSEDDLYNSAPGKSLGSDKWKEKGARYQERDERDGKETDKNDPAQDLSIHGYYPIIVINSMKKALITGITGQDGSYLAELLLEKGYEVHGIQRPSSSIRTARIDHLFNDPSIHDKTLFLHHGDLTDTTNISNLIRQIEPDEVYNLAAQSHVRISFDLPELTAETDALGTLTILESIRKQGLTNKIKFYQASTSELYGKVLETPQTEETPFYPRSPYGVAKLYAFWIIKNYREAYDMFACNGILFNHESERRGYNFVTRKITTGLSRIKLGQQEVLELGNLDAKRDWGYAKEYAEAMWLMLQQDKAEDFVIATGETHSVREFIEECCTHLNIELEWRGKEEKEVGIDKKSGKTIIKINPRYFRPTEVDVLLGDPSKAKKKLGWEAKTKFKDLAKLMVESDYELMKRTGGEVRF